MEKVKEPIYDVVILGAGPAGLSAAIFSARYGIKTAVISREIGGMARYAMLVENYPPFSGSGIELMNAFVEQAKKCGAEIMEREIVSIKKEKQFIVQTSKNELIKSKSLILCLGTEKKKLNIPGEDKFLGRGVSYCATCDAPLFRGKSVAVIGGKNSAAQAALLLSINSKKVYIVYRQNQLNCDDILAMKIKNKDNIEVLYEVVPLGIKGKDSAEKLIVNEKGKEKELKVDGVFVEIGSVPSTSLVNEIGVKTDDSSYILVDKEMKTNIKGVFAAGDITATPLMQIITASANGAIASSSAYKFLKEEKS